MNILQIFNTNVFLDKKYYLLVFFSFFLNMLLYSFFLRDMRAIPVMGSIYQRFWRREQRKRVDCTFMTGSLRFA